MCSYFDILPEDIGNVILDLVEVNTVKQLYYTDIFKDILDKSCFWINLIRKTLTHLDTNILKLNKTFNTIFIDSIYDSKFNIFILRYNTYNKIITHYKELVNKYYYGNGIIYENFEFGLLEQRLIDTLEQTSISSYDEDIRRVVYTTFKYNYGVFFNLELRFFSHHTKNFVSVNISINTFNMIQLYLFLNNLEIKYEMLSLFKK